MKAMLLGNENNVIVRSYANLIQRNYYFAQTAFFSLYVVTEQFSFDKVVETQNS